MNTGASGVSVGDPDGVGFKSLLTDENGKKDQQIAELQADLAAERDARREDRFVGLVVIVILLDISVFSVMPTFGGPLALLVLQLLVLIPLASRMGMEEVKTILSNVLNRMAGRAGDSK